MRSRWVVVADSPFLPADGGGEREHLGFVTSAAALGRLALLVVPTPEPFDDTPYRDALGGVPVLQTPRRTSPLLLASPVRPYVVASRPAPSWLVSRTRALAPDATGIVVFSYKSWLLGQRLATASGLPAVLRQHNLEGAYHRSLARETRGLRKLVLHVEASRIERDERRLERAPWLAGIADISAADAAHRRSRGAASTHVPPFAFSTGPAEPLCREADTGRVLFLGALDVATNTAALEWFLGEVWPRVLAERPDAVLDVVGRRPSPALRRMLAGRGSVELHADVPELEPYLARAGVAVNPAVSGSGVNIKLIDYLQAGVPVVSTSLATRGLALDSGQDLEVHDAPGDFAAAVLDLLGNPERARTMSERGRARIAELLDPETNMARIADLLDPDLVTT